MNFKLGSHHIPKTSHIFPSTRWNKAKQPQKSERLLRFSVPPSYKYAICCKERPRFCLRESQQGEGVGGKEQPDFNFSINLIGKSNGFA